MNPKRQSTGSRPLKPDHRDFKLHPYFGAASIAMLPPGGLGRKPFSLNNQSYTQYCTACATSEANAFLRGVPMSFEWQAAKIGQLAGAPILNGADPRVAMKAGILYGSLPKDKAPYSLSDGAEFVAQYLSWSPSLDLIAGQNEDASYFQVNTGPYDAFDNIRAALWDAYQERIANKEDKQDVVMAFTQWFQEFNVTRVTYVPPRPLAGTSPIFSGIMNFLQRFLPSIFGGEFWHAYLFIDWNNRDELVVQNSYGNAWGDAGLQYFSRATVNALFADYRAGAFMYKEVKPGDVKSWQEQQSSLQSVYAYIINRLTGK
jgi:hypothetical protein